MSLSSYASTAYSPASLQSQPPARPRTGLKRLTGQRLPWGNTQEVVPEVFMRPEPELLRFREEESRRKAEQQSNGTYKPKPMEKIDFHDRCDHEHYRYAPWAKRSQFWLFLHPFGKVGFFLFLLVGLCVSFLDGTGSKEGFILGFWKSFVFLSWYFLFPCLAAWGLASLVIHKFPRLWAKPGKGPKWELNRRTGMITVFKYRRGRVDEQRAPFHEFDAYINTTPDRQGLPMNVLSLEHRYSDISIYFGDLQPPDRNTQELCALWDFIQNYMDTSHPLPDAPLFEEHRRNDPTTVEYDKAAGRNPRYWIDMDDETFKQEQSRMRGRVDAINTFSRPNLMAQYVKYEL
tara:strand:- start:48463 stop:49500 length:1038 start_codon:yes stop_codon:yes gene_type:complete